MDQRSNQSIVVYLYDVDRSPPKKANIEIQFGRVKAFLYENLHRAVTRHDLKLCYKILKLLPKEKTLDPHVLFRFVMILLESNLPEDVNKNVIIYLESQLSNLNLSKPEIFVEFLAYFFRHDRIDDAREMYAQRHRYMTIKIHRPMPLVNINLRCYVFLFKYIEWEEKLMKGKARSHLSVSIQGWIVNLLSCLKNVEGNYEYFVRCIAKVLVYYGYTKKAYLIVSEFSRRNPDNLGAQLLYYHLINMLYPNWKYRGDQDEMDASFDKQRAHELRTINNFSRDMNAETFNPICWPIEEEKSMLLNNLRRLNITGKEVVKLNKHNSDQYTALKDLLDGMEHVSEIRNSRRWKKIKRAINAILESGDEALIESIGSLWTNNYDRHWRRIDFIAIAGDRVSEKDKQLIKEVTSSLRSLMS